MPIVTTIIVLFILYIAYKLLIDGLLFKIPLFFGGWFGIYIFLRVFVNGAKDVAITLNNGFTISWAAIVPTTICVLALLCTRTES